MLAVLGLLTPLLRTLANVAALGGHDACSQLLSLPACKLHTSASAPVDMHAPKTSNLSMLCIKHSSK